MLLGAKAIAYPNAETGAAAGVSFNETLQKLLHDLDLLEADPATATVSEIVPERGRADMDSDADISVDEDLKPSISRIFPAVRPVVRATQKNVPPSGMRETWTRSMPGVENTS